MCNCFVQDTVNVLHLAVYSIKRFWRNTTSAKSSTPLNVMYICLRIVTFRNTQIQIHANVLKNLFPPNIVHAKYNTFTAVRF